MKAGIKLNLAYQKRLGSAERVQVEGSTVKECLDNFVIRFPAARPWLFDKDEKLQSLVLLNGENLSQGQLVRPISENDELWILDVLEGG